jgi:sugar transferase (PEP-CTERM/EpsH1 system associated)
MMKRDLVFLTQRIPYPPNKGDKIRSYHILQRLARDFRIHLGCFIDDPHDARHRPRFSELCASVAAIPLAKPWALTRGAWHLATGRALSEGYFKDRRLVRWLGETLAATGARHLFVYCSAMAPYAFGHTSGRTVLMDMVDMDSEKFRAYGQKASWPLSALYRREAGALLALERKAARTFDRSFLATANELQLFLARAPECAAKTEFFSNGVDTGFYDPALAGESPYPPQAQAIAFTGAMDYEPNIDAVTWFAGTAFPAIRARYPRAEFWIVGANPAAQVQGLASRDGIHVTGRVADMRPFLRHAACLVAPLRIARGVQNKVLEGMAMDRTMVVTRAAWHGLSAVPGEELFLAEDEQEFSVAVADVLEGRLVARGARARILADYDWDRNLHVLTRFLEPAA